MSPYMSLLEFLLGALVVGTFTACFAYIFWDGAKNRKERAKTVAKFLEAPLDFVVATAAGVLWLIFLVTLLLVVMGWELKLFGFDLWGASFLAALAATLVLMFWPQR